MEKSGSIKMVCVGLLGVFAILLASTDAQAVVVYEYTLENSGDGYAFDFNHVFGQAVYDTHPAAIHGDFGGGASDHFVVTNQPANIEFHVNENNSTLERVVISNYKASITGRELNYQTGKVSPGTQGDFNAISLNLDADLRGLDTEVVLGANSRATGELSARLKEAIENRGQLEATGVGAFGNFVLGVAKAGDPINCAFCLGHWGDYGDFLGPVADFKEGLSNTLRPMFSTWLPISGSYIDPNTGQLRTVSASLDLNGYLNFRGARDTEAVPEPASLMLLSLALAGARLKRKD